MSYARRFFPLLFLSVAVCVCEDEGERACSIVEVTVVTQCWFICEIQEDLDDGRRRQ